MEEGLIPKLAGQRPKHAKFKSLEECAEVIESFISHHNESEVKDLEGNGNPRICPLCVNGAA